MPIDRRSSIVADIQCACSLQCRQGFPPHDESRTSEPSRTFTIFATSSSKSAVIQTDELADHGAVSFCRSRRCQSLSSGQVPHGISESRPALTPTVYVRVSAHKCSSRVSWAAELGWFWARSRMISHDGPILKVLEGPVLQISALLRRLEEEEALLFQVGGPRGTDL